MKLKNNSAAVVCMGEFNLIPGGVAVDVGTDWPKHPEVKAYIKSGVLVIVKDASKDTAADDVADNSNTDQAGA